MTNLKSLKSVSGMVQRLLEEHPNTRSSDNTLYYMVCRDIGRQNGVNIEQMSMPQFLLRMKEYGFPPFESVRRSRQKIQHDHPELSADANVEAARMLNEEVYRKFARE